MIVYDIQTEYWLDNSTLTELDELCERLGATRAHMVRCAVLNVDAEDLDPRPLDIHDTPRIGKRPTGHAHGVGLNRRMLRLTYAEYEVLCRVAMMKGISRAEQVSQAVWHLVWRVGEVTKRGWADTMNAVLLDQWARRLLSEMPSCEDTMHQSDKHDPLHAPSTTS